MYTVLRGGYNSKHPKEFVMYRPNGLYCYLFLIVRSPAYMQIGAERFVIETNSAVIIQPNIPYEYAGIESEYKNDWLYVESSEPDFEEKYGQLFNHPIPLSNSLQFTQYFQHIVWENNYGDEEHRKENVSLLLQVVFNKLLQEKKSLKEQKEYNPYAAELQELRLMMKDRPDKNFTPMELAAAMNVSPSYFQALYKEFFGVPFKTDLIQMRLEYARELILETGLPLNQIAELSGYSNEIHFYRQFKAKTGMTPREYQESMRRR